MKNEAIKNLSNLIIQSGNKSFAESGTELLDSSNLSSTAPFRGFIVGSNGVTISSFTTSNKNSGGNYTNFPYSAGAWYPISGTEMTITSGEVILIR